MAFNHNYQVEYPRRVSLDNSPLQASSSILSDSQSLWVLFSPSLQTPIANESDILSLTNNTRTDTDAESVEGSNSALQETQQGPFSSEEWTRLDEEQQGTNSETTERRRTGLQSESDSLIDHLAEGDVQGIRCQTKGASYSVAATKSRQSRLFETPGSELHRRINKWRNNNLDEMVDDNTASWDLDEDLSLQPSPAKAERTKRPFYGDDVFAKLSEQEYINFRNVEKNLKQSLEALNNQSYLPFIINQILYKLAHSSANAVEQPSLGTLKTELQKYSSLLKENNTQSFLDSIIETHLRNSHMMHVANTRRPISDSTSASSLILCGGSWNEL
mmetsp:Transcript_8497/g.8406  ORF Transcript_8497/g.8406 Transcript_8497/m.8406 type:complete len:331 (-) Transcript_8497:388-1380(-)